MAALTLKWSIVWHIMQILIHPRNLGKISIFVDFYGSFAVKNDNIHIFFVANFEFAGFAPKQKYKVWTVTMETVRTAKSRPRKNQSERKYLPKTGFAI